MKNFKTALVLGGGGVRGFAQIGVLKVLEEMGVKIDIIAGCSMGAVIGYFYAAGKSPAEIEALVLKTKIQDFFDISFGSLGIKRTDKAQKILEDFAGVKLFEDLKIPLYVNATNISRGREKIFSTGQIFPAVRASISVPGMFAPYEIDGDFYIDGGALNQNPFSILPKNNYKYIIVDVSPVDNFRGINSMNLAKVMENSLKLMQAEISGLKLKELKENDYVIIKPAVEDYSIIQKTKFFADIIEKGEDEARVRKMEIIKLLR